MDLILYLKQLDENSSAVMRLAKSFNADTLQLKKDESWTILEIMEHICLTDLAVITRIQKPSEEIHDEEASFGNEKLQRMLVGLREKKKFISPERLQPKGILENTAQFEALFTKQRNILKSLLLDGSIVIDNRLFLHPFLGNMTVSDWLYFVIYHTERHMKQMEETANL